MDTLLIRSIIKKITGQSNKMMADQLTKLSNIYVKRALDIGKDDKMLTEAAKVYKKLADNHKREAKDFNVDKSLEEVIKDKCYLSYLSIHTMLTVDSNQCLLYVKENIKDGYKPSESRMMSSVEDLARKYCAHWVKFSMRRFTKAYTLELENNLKSILTKEGLSRLDILNIEKLYKMYRKYEYEKEAPAEDPKEKRSCERKEKENNESGSYWSDNT